MHRAILLFAFVACDADPALGRTSDDPGPTAAGDGSPNWHWVLRDADGQSVQAIIHGPTCPTDGWEECAGSAGPNAVPADYPCVDIAWVGGLARGSIYDLATGRPEPCTDLDQPDVVKDALGNPPYRLTLEP